MYNCDLLKLTRNKKVIELYQTNDIEVIIIDDENYYIEKCKTNAVYNIIIKLLENRKGKLLNYIY